MWLKVVLVCHEHPALPSLPLLDTPYTLNMPEIQAGYQIPQVESTLSWRFKHNCSEYKNQTMAEVTPVPR